MQHHFLDMIQKDHKSMQMTMRLKHVVNFKSIFNVLMLWGFSEYVFIVFRNCAKECGL